MILIIFWDANIIHGTKYKKQQNSKWKASTTDDQQNVDFRHVKVVPNPFRALNIASHIDCDRIQ